MYCHGLLSTVRHMGVYDTMILNLNERIHLNYYQGLRCCVFNVSSLHVEHYCCCFRLCAFEGWSRKALDSLCRRCWKEQNRRRKYHNLGQEIRTQKHHQMLHTMVNQTLQIQIQKKNQNGHPRSRLVNWRAWGISEHGHGHGHIEEWRWIAGQDEQEKWSGQEEDDQL